LGIAWSPDGRYIAIGCPTTEPFVEEGQPVGLCLEEVKMR
jgi:hypothetical protein